MITAKTKVYAFINTRQIPYPFDNNPEELIPVSQNSEVNKNRQKNFKPKIFLTSQCLALTL
jgi:hypothetical protein